MVPRRSTRIWVNNLSYYNVSSWLIGCRSERKGLWFVSSRGFLGEGQMGVGVREEEVAIRSECCRALAHPVPKKEECWSKRDRIRWLVPMGSGEKKKTTRSEGGIPPSLSSATLSQRVGDDDAIAPCHPVSAMRSWGASMERRDRSVPEMRLWPLDQLLATEIKRDDNHK
jgi:hypothetical protein